MNFTTHASSPEIDFVVTEACLSFKTTRSSQDVLFVYCIIRSIRSNHIDVYTLDKLNHFAIVSSPVQFCLITHEI